ncbi:MAG: Hsp20/alpha crystallin family protein [Geoalkalibacter sp.]|jgi:HSP20 family protein|uniref:Hsp20/alpha crystallin family protein n=1 Tax=Geoalkalibacter sp. TaxID=3041440 RepID=UPI002A9388F6|nr:Hsp20/alpha crystallin family protein [Thermodesulfobacteriota bacterium]
MAYPDIFTEMENLRREIDDAFRGFGMGRAVPGFLPGIGTSRYPAINLGEDHDNLYVQALMPGVDPQQVELNIMKGTLTIAGERKQSDENEKTWHRRERGMGHFLRAVELPSAVDPNKAQARYDNGILTVTLPKAEEAKPKKINVSVA